MKKIRIAFLLLLVITIGVARAQRVSLTIPSGHAKAIDRIAVSPNGKYVASASYKTVMIWDIAGNKKIHELNIAAETNSLAITDRLDKVVVATNDGLYCYNIQTGKQLFRNGTAVSGAIFNKDGSLIYAMDDATLYLLDANTGNRIKYISKAANGTGRRCRLYELGDNRLFILYYAGWSMVNTATGEILLKQEFKDVYNQKMAAFDYNAADNTVIGLHDHEFVVYDAATANLIKTKKPLYYPEGFCVSGKNQLTVFSEDFKSKSYKIEVVELPSFNVVKTITQPGSEVQESIFYGNCPSPIPGTAKVMFNNNKELYLLNIADGNYEKKFSNSIADFKPFYYYANLSQRLLADNSLVFSTDDNGIRNFDMELFKPGTYMPASAHVVYSPDGSIAAGIGKTITITDIKTGRLLKKIPLPAGIKDDEEFFFFSNDNKKLYYSNRDKGSLNTLDLSTGISAQLISFGGTFYECSSSYDGKYFACRAGDNLKIYNLQTKQAVLSKRACDPNKPDECITSFRFLNDSYYLFVTRNKDNISIFKADDPAYVSNFQIPQYNRLSVLGGDIRNNIIAIGEVGQFQVGTYNLKLITLEGKILKEFRSANNNDFLKAAFSKDDKVMFTPTTQKGIQVWNVQTGELLGTYYFIEKLNEYIFVSPEGLFDGSEKGMKALYFVKNNKPVPLEKLYEQYFTPGLLRRKLNGEKFLPPDVAGLLDVPVVSIAYAEKQRNLSVDDDVPVYQNTNGIAEITVKADAGEGSIDEIRLFHNGKIVTLVTRNLIVTDDKAKTAVKKYTINLLPGSNAIRAVALNTQRTESDPDQITVVYNAGNNSGVTPPVVNTGSGTVVDKIDKNATLHLIVVGINAYKNPKMSLNYALADATAFKDEIEKGAKTVISNIKPYFVTDDAADKQGIVSALNTIQQTAKPQDVFIFYYAGHGVIAGGNNEFYLVPNDVMDLKNVDEALKVSGIAARELQQYAINIQAQKQLFILDACQSAGAFAAMLSADGNQQKNIALVARSTGTHWMAASGAQQFANEFSALGHGAFTYVLLQALKGEAASNKMITVDGLKNYMQTGVPALMKKYNSSQQTPANYGFGNDFPVVLLK